eukprot:CAMPEP_0113297638 /NCGR_PEP_ID=MMETSP0010_2-20120614/417_1 /TAXON_ID=216773 ORGANISM="Corethron hystrix, Strain 308" /NCGR_SAMPLE_ID=MMETSP0010_2 /ASSEMBLY_ACC=CAM_ASM_000155 /LENGTH=157 /DNA_ID=CAMNT_0000150561 /DNA_START=409 /DNA_END=883 /DNA_ORIENTATION=+ /assembly_acc=CAM_ASM_000155
MAEVGSVSSDEFSCVTALSEMADSVGEAARTPVDNSLPPKKINGSNLEKLNNRSSELIFNSNSACRGKRLHQNSSSGLGEVVLENDQLIFDPGASNKNDPGRKISRDINESAHDDLERNLEIICPSENLEALKISDDKNEKNASQETVFTKIVIRVI